MLTIGREDTIKQLLLTRFHERKILFSIYSIYTTLLGSYYDFLHALYD